MSLHLKNSHRCGLDTSIYNKIPKQIKLVKDFYLYIFDYAIEQKHYNDDFYSEKNTSSNTWNYNLQFISTDKHQIECDSTKFGFGSCKYTEYDTNIIVKGKNHMCSNEKLYQAHIVKKEIYHKNYDKTKFIGQKILKTDNSNYNTELNIFVMKNLITKQFNFVCFLLINNTNKDINRKLSKDNTIYKADISIIDSFKDNLIQYLSFIHFDYGRIELIKDIERGWCIIDINNSPSAGELGNMACNDLVSILINSCKE
jgi:hypothetical protein